MPMVVVAAAWARNSLKVNMCIVLALCRTGSVGEENIHIISHVWVATVF